MFSPRTSDVRSGTSRLDAQDFENGTGVASCCGTSLGTWNGDSHGSWNDRTGHGTFDDGTSHGTWAVTTTNYAAESTEVFPLNENASLSIDSFQTPWASDPQYSAWQIIVLSTLAGLTSLVTVGGNLTVLLSFLIERTIRQPTNYFIASLACSDLLIGVFSMPLYTVYLLTGTRWPLGEVICDLWLSVDYTACLCSIYTVFCITIDRFCSVSIPTKYRNWRTASKVRVLVAMTWILPIVVFFTTIFGWQFFVGGRTVREGKCYVQYMENAVFNCALQVGYFWTTLVVMCALYAGIYRVALKLQRKAEAKLTKMVTALTVDANRVENIHRPPVGDEQERPRDATEGPVSTPDGEFTVKGILGGRVFPPGVLPVVSIIAIPASVNEERYSSSPGFLSDTEEPSSPSVQTISQRRNSSPFVKLSSSDVIKTSSGLNVGCNRLLRPPPTRREMTMRSLQRYFQSQQLEANAIEAYRRRSSGDTEPTRCQRDHNCVKALESGEQRTIRRPEEELAVGNRANGHSEFMEAAGTELDDVPVENRSLSNNAADNEKCQARFQYGDVAVASIQRSPVWKRRNGTSADSHFYSVDREMAQLTRDHDDGVNRSRSVVTYSTTVDSFNDTVSGQTLSASRLNYPRQIFDPCEGYQRQGYSIDYSTSDTLDDSATPIEESSRWQLTDDSQLPSSDHQGAESPSAKRNSRPASTRQSASQLCRTKSSRRSRRVRPGSAKVQQQPGRGRKTVNRAKKALRTITIILGAFVACWTPWHILSLIVGFCPDYAAALQTLYDVSYWLCYLNSPINPFCYAFANHQLKKTFLRILRLDWHRT